MSLFVERSQNSTAISRGYRWNKADKSALFDKLMPADIRIIAPKERTGSADKLTTRHRSTGAAPRYVFNGGQE